MSISNLRQQVDSDCRENIISKIISDILPFLTIIYAGGWLEGTLEEKVGVGERSTWSPCPEVIGIKYYFSVIFKTKDSKIIDSSPIQSCAIRLKPRHLLYLDVMGCNNLWKIVQPDFHLHFLFSSKCRHGICHKLYTDKIFSIISLPKKRVNYKHLTFVTKERKLYIHIVSSNQIQ